MSASIDNLVSALTEATANRPAERGFPYFAETLRQAGVHRNEWSLPSMQSLYVTDLGAVMITAAALEDGPSDVAVFDEPRLVAALRADQAGELTFSQFAHQVWRAGVIRWIVDLDNRECTYVGCTGQQFTETYPGVSVTTGVRSAG